MQKTIFILLLMMIPFFSVAYTEDFPNTLNYQGYLQNQGDGSVVDGTIDMIFEIYDVETGNDDQPLWKEEHYGVSVEKGVFSVVLGAQSSVDLQSLSFEKGLYLGLTVGGEKMGSRIKFNTTTSAIVAKYAIEAKSVAPNTISSSDIIDGAISTSDIASSAIKSNHIGENVIQKNHIANQAVGKEQIETGAITEDKIAPETMKSITNKQKGTFITLIAGEQMSGSEKPVAVYQDKEGLIISQTSGNLDAKTFGINRYAQIFKTDIGTTKIEKIALHITKTGTISGVIEVRIHEMDSTNNPIITHLTNAMTTKDANEIENGWNLFEFEQDVQVHPLTYYAIAISLPQGDKDNYVSWKYDHANHYADGNFISCQNYANQWSHESENDFTFKIYSNQRVFKCSANDVKTSGFIGFAVTDADKGEEISVQTSGIVEGFDGLDIGSKYYLLNESGEIGNNYQGMLKLVGVSVGKTLLAILWETTIIKPKKIARATGLGPSDNKDSGQITSRVLIFNKIYDDTDIRIGYTDNFRSIYSNGCRWEIQVDGKSCQNRLVFDFYTTENTHRSQHLVGYCEGVQSGPNEIQIWVGCTPDYSSCDCCTGWHNSRWTIEAEEVY